MTKLLLGIFLILTLLPSCSSSDLVSKKRSEHLLKKERSNNALDNAEQLQNDLNREL
jgi:hypothetical protein